ncbi:MAG TPA: glycosyltransferase family 39 protein, partial [Lacunisphaera sp.]|nr:glycosyltransferase family 39 protein [Lacunisphaera sp.]
PKTGQVDDLPPHHPGWQWLVPLLAGIAFVLVCFAASPHQLLWHDERYTLLLVGQGDFAQMMRGIHEGIDGSPPVYLVLLRCWATVAGVSPFALRLFSALAMSAAFAATWLLARRMAGFPAASVGCAAVFFGNALVFRLNVECRHYALVIALLAFLLLQFERISRPGRVSRGALALYALTTGVLVLTHLFGFVFSGLLAVAMVTADRLRGDFRPARYAVAIAGWLAFLPWLPHFLNQAKIGQPWFWISMPSASVLTRTSSYAYGISSLILPSFLAISLVYPLLRRAAIGPGARSAKLLSTSAIPVAVAAAFLIAGVPVATWLISVVAQPVWVDRYQFPALVGWSIALPLLLRAFGVFQWDHIAGKSAVLRIWRHVETVACILFLAGALLHFGLRIKKIPSEPVPHQMAPLSLPLAVRDSHIFTYLRTYEPQIDVWYVLDWEAALRSPVKGLVAGHNIMAAVKKTYPETKVIGSDEFLARFKNFYIIEQQDSNWLQDPSRAEASYQVHPADRSLMLPHSRRFTATRLSRVEPATAPAGQP